MLAYVDAANRITDCVFTFWEIMRHYTEENACQTKHYHSISNGSTVYSDVSTYSSFFNFICLAFGLTVILPNSEAFKLKTGTQPLTCIYLNYTHVGARNTYTWLHTIHIFYSFLTPAARSWLTSSKIVHSFKLKSKNWRYYNIFELKIQG